MGWLLLYGLTFTKEEKKIKFERVVIYIINFDINIPIYIQVIDHIRICIINGTFNLGDKLPSIRGMAENLKINTNTMSRAYHNLLLDGFIYKKIGMEYFVTDNKRAIENLKINEINKIFSTFILNMKIFNFSSNEMIEFTQRKLNHVNSTQ